MLLVTHSKAGQNKSLYDNWKKIKNKISDLNTNIPIIILNVNALNTNIKRQRFVDFFLMT